MKKNIAILMGGYSNEYKISLESGEVVFNTLKNIFNCYKIHILEDNWVYIENTNLSDNSWKRNRCLLSDYISLTNNVVFKVSAEDVFNEGDFGSGGSLVEAAFDDFSLQAIDYEYLLGDANNDSLLNVLDVVLIVNFALDTQEPSNVQYQSSDVNQDGVINILDVVLLVNLVLDN